MNLQKILFVINPKSGDTDKSNLEQLIQTACAKNNKDYSLFYTSGHNDKEKIEIKQRQYLADAIVACGGDGTVNLVAQVVHSSDTMLGIIPLGSANGLAHELQIEENIPKSLEKLMSGNYLKIDLIKINDRHICLHLSDLGFNAKMLKDFEENGERGMLAYAKSFFGALMDKKATNFTVEFNGTTEEVTAEMIVIANASSYGTGAVINPKSSLDDGHFELIIFKPIPMKNLLYLTLESFLGGIHDSPYVEICKVKKARIHCKAAELLQIDGELMGEHTDVTATILKDAIKVLI